MKYCSHNRPNTRLHLRNELRFTVIQYSYTPSAYHDTMGLCMVSIFFFFSLFVELMSLNENKIVKHASNDLLILFVCVSGRKINMSKKVAFDI